MRYFSLAIVVTAIIAAIIFLQKEKPMNISAKPKTSGAYAHDLVNPGRFINSEPFKIADLVGKKVILVDFWTYSCINCKRTQPYLNAWWDKYKDKGLMIIGVHTPEFEFEKIYDNVVAAVQKENIKYPVVQDNDYETWNAYGNRYWPRKYLIDLKGDIVYDHIGEGAYDETEKKIQELLNAEAPIESQIVAPSSGSPEIYFGSARNGGHSEYLLPASAWKIEPEYALAIATGAKIVYKYKAKNVFFVADSDKPVEIEVFRDGKLFNTITVQGAQLYTLIQDQSFGEHTIELRIKGTGLKAFTFTFG